MRFLLVEITGGLKMLNAFMGFRCLWFGEISIALTGDSEVELHIGTILLFDRSPSSDSFLSVKVSGD